MSDIAKAYVQIIPSAEGIKGSLEKIIGEEADNTGKKAGGSISQGVGKALGGLAKVSAATMAAAGTAVTALSKSAIDAYKDFEQLEGGIETLFGSSAPAVMKNAEQAFQTAGQSMNEYMETSIQSAAAMISSLGGNQAKAAKLMDMSIIDMADNVNKMGTSMEGVQNAYRGFSRGNFTMLDNLALGFAGTKEGMQELLDKAKELSGVEYDIESYADIVQAIHVVQEDMGIAGTTAKEGAETISGSLGQMKSAWENLVSGLANPKADLGKLIDNMVKSGETALDNLMPAIEHALVGIASFIEKAAPIIADKLPGIIEKILPSLLNAASTMVDALIDALPSLLKAVTDSIAQNPEILTTLGPILLLKLSGSLLKNMDLLKPVGDAIVKKITASAASSAAAEATGAGAGAVLKTGTVAAGNFLTADIGTTLAAGGAAAGATIGTAVAGGAVAAVAGAEVGKTIGAKLFPDDAELYEEYSGVTGTMRMLKDFLFDLNDQIGEGMKKYWANLKEAAILFWEGRMEYFHAWKAQAIVVWNGIKDGVVNIVDGMITAIKDFFNSLGDFFSDLGTRAWNWGKDIVTGIKDGIMGGIDSIKTACVNIGNIIKSYLHFSEPDIGPLSNFNDWMPDMMNQMAQQINEGIPGVTSAMQNVTKSIAGDVRGAMPNLTSSLQDGGKYSAAVAPAGYGNLTIPVYIGNQKFTQAVVRADQLNNYRSGGR